MCIRRFLLLAATALLVFVWTKAYAISDVPSHSRYSEAFTYLTKRKIVQGFADGTVRPFDPISRVEGLTAILRSNEKYAPQVVWFRDNLPELPLFSDVEQSAWYAPYVEVGFLEGVVKGGGNGILGPGVALTAAEALVMLHRVYGKTERQMSYRTGETLPNWPDQWFSDAVSASHARNLIPPFEYLALNAPITRGQFFAILHRLHTIEQSGEFAYIDPPSTTAQTFQPSKLSKLSIPFSITPLPFTPKDPFVLWLPGRRTSNPPAKEINEYASTQEFAITIPALDIHDVAVIHPEDPFSSSGILEPLKIGLGHLFTYPGDDGKIMIYGHSSSFPWDISEYTRVFRQINKLVSGQRVYITYQDTLYVYEVYRKQVVDANDVSAFDDNGVSELILYTCWPPDSIKQRYLVHAVPVDTVALR